MSEMTRNRFILSPYAAIARNSAAGAGAERTAIRRSVRFVRALSGEVLSAAVPIWDFPFWESLAAAIRCCKSLLAVAGDEEITAFSKIPAYLAVATPVARRPWLVAVGRSS